MTAASFVIDANSSTVATAAVDRAVEPLRLAGGPPCRLATVAMAFGRVRLGW